MKSGVYIITNIVHSKVYVGASKDTKNRWRSHRWYLRKGIHPNRDLQAAWDAVGEAGLCFEVLEYCESVDLQEREDWWIALLETMNPEKGYNKWSADRQQCAEDTREKCSAAMRGRKMPPRSAEYRMKQSLAKKGQHSSFATEIQVGQRISPETEFKPGQRPWNAGKKLSLELREKLSAAHRGKPWTEAQRRARQKDKST